MSLFSSHHDLFHQPSLAEKISFVRSLMETGALNADAALALLKSIHTELAQPQGNNPSHYASYARLMASLRHEIPEVYQHVVANWQAVQSVHAQPEETSSKDDLPKTVTSVEAKQTEMYDVEEVGQGKAFWETEGKVVEEEEPGEEPPMEAAK